MHGVEQPCYADDAGGVEITLRSATSFTTSKRLDQILDTTCINEEYPCSVLAQLGSSKASLPGLWLQSHLWEVTALEDS